MNPCLFCWRTRPNNRHGYLSCEPCQIALGHMLHRQATRAELAAIALDVYFGVRRLPA